MTPHRWIRAATFGYGFMALAHTAAMFAPSSGPDEDRVVAAMQGWTFDAMGSQRTVWDFHVGEGFYLSVFAVLMATLAWVVGDLGRTQPAHARKLGVVLLGASLASVGLCVRYFFVAPLLTSVIGTVGIAGALWGWRR